MKIYLESESLLYKDYLVHFDALVSAYCLLFLIVCVNIMVSGVFWLAWAVMVDDDTSDAGIICWH